MREWLKRHLNLATDHDHHLISVGPWHPWTTGRGPIGYLRCATDGCSAVFEAHLPR